MSKSDTSAGPGDAGWPADGAAADAGARPLPACIGIATMSADGSIVLMLRTELDDGTVGEGRFVYPKSHPKYAEILQHLGGLAPGESKPVTPFPD